MALPLHPQDVGHAGSSVRWTGDLHVDPGELRSVIRQGWLEDGIQGWYAAAHIDEGRVIFLPKPNLVVDTGVTRVQNLGWAIGGALQAVNTMSVDNGANGPTASSTSLVSDAGPPTSVRMQAFDSAATQTTKVVSQTATYTQAIVSFVMKRLALSFVAPGSLPVTTTGTVPANSLHSMTGVFTIDLTSFTTWTQQFTAQVTGTGS